MNSAIQLHPLSCAMLAPLLALTPAWASAQGTALSPEESVMLSALADPGLGSMRAGRFDAPAPLADAERVQLEVAELRSEPLADLRGGRAMDDDAWPWIAVGAAVVLLIVLL